MTAREQIGVDQRRSGRHSPATRRAALPSMARVARTVQRCAAITMNRHVHHRRDGITVICTGAWCAPSRAREIAWRALLVAGPVAVLATSGALGLLRSSSRLALALLALAALLTWWATRAPGAPRVERDVRAANAPRDQATRPGGGSLNASR